MKMVAFSTEYLIDGSILSSSGAGYKCGIYFPQKSMGRYELSKLLNFQTSFSPYHKLLNPMYCFLSRFNYANTTQSIR